MDENEFDFEFDFFPEHSTGTATADTDEELLWEESRDDQPRRRTPAATPPHIVQRRRVAAGAAVALLLLIILIVVLTSGGGGGGGGAYRAYVNDVSAIASESAQAGASLSSVTAKNAASKLDAAIQQTTDDINRLQALVPPKELEASQAQALAALDLRLLGLQQLRSAQAGASPDTAVATLVTSD